MRLRHSVGAETEICGSTKYKMTNCAQAHAAKHKYLSPDELSSKRELPCGKYLPQIDCTGMSRNCFTTCRLPLSTRNSKTCVCGKSSRRTALQAAMSNRYCSICRQASLKKKFSPIVTFLSVCIAPSTLRRFQEACSTV